MDIFSQMFLLKMYIVCIVDNGMYAYMFCDYVHKTYMF